MQPKQLIFCADDYAASSAISRGIITLASAGRISATSAMTLSPRWAQDAPALRELRDRIDVGLHLDCTSIFASAAGCGMELPRAMLRSVVGGLPRQWARTLIERQLDAFETHWQAPPNHVDGHQHIHQFSGIREELVSVLAQRYAQHSPKPWLRISRVSAAQAGLKGMTITALGAAKLQHLAHNVQLPCASQLWGVYDFTGNSSRYTALLEKWVVRAPTGSVIMCHPANNLGDTSGGGAHDPIAAARQWEFEVLNGHFLPQMLARHATALTRGSTIWSVKNVNLVRQASTPS